MFANTESPSIPPEKIAQYRNVAKLAEAGATDGERNAAERTLAKMRIKYPGIEDAARAAERREAKNHRPGPTSPSAAPAGSFWDAFKQVFRFTSDILAEAQAGLETATAAAALCEQLDDISDTVLKDVTVKGAPTVRMQIDMDAEVLRDILLARKGDASVSSAVAVHFGKRCEDAFADLMRAFDEDTDDDDE